MHVAALNRDVEMIELLLGPLQSSEEKSYAVNGSTLDGMTPLHLAVQNDSQRCLELLVEAGVEMDRNDVWGREPIHIAARWARKEALNLILKTKRWSFASDSLGHTPIDYLLATNDSHRRITDPERLESFVRFYFKNPQWQDQRGKTFLHHAIQKTDTKTVQTLLNDNTGTIVADSEGATPLMLAVEHNMEQIVDHLLEPNGAVISAKRQNDQDNDGNSAAHRVLANTNNSYPNDFERVRMLHVLHSAGCSLAQENAEGNTVLFEALLRHYEPVAKYLLEPTEKGVPKAIGRVKPTLLYDACLAGSADAVQTILHLCDSGANQALSAADLINAIGDEYSHTPITISCAEDRTAIIKMLVADERTDLNWAATGRLCGTPLHIVAYHSNLEALSVLLEQWPSRVNTNVFDKECRTPLDIAIQQGKTDCAEKLLRHLLMSKPYQRNHVEIITGRRPGYMIERLNDLLSKVLGLMAEDMSLTDDDLAWLVHATNGFDCWSLCDVFMRRALDSSAWQLIPDLYQIALGADNPDLLTQLLNMGVDRNNINDEDGWSLEYYAQRFNKEKLLTSVLKSIKLAEPPGQAPKAYSMPGRLLWDDEEDHVSIRRCSRAGHDGCSGINGMLIRRSIRQKTITDNTFQKSASTIRGIQISSAFGVSTAFLLPRHGAISTMKLRYSKIVTLSTITLPSQPR